MEVLGTSSGRQISLSLNLMSCGTVLCRAEDFDRFPDSSWVPMLDGAMSSALSHLMRWSDECACLMMADFSKLHEFYQRVTTLVVAILCVTQSIVCSVRMSWNHTSTLMAIAFCVLYLNNV